MSKIIKIISLIILNPIIIFGLYVIVHGHLTPGGGFQGGAIIAGATALILVVFENNIKLSRGLFSLFEFLGLTSFILMAFWGIVKNTFFYNFLTNSNGILGKTIVFGINQGYLNSGGVIPLMNLSVGIEVASGLSLIIILITRNL
ncbi:MAG: sodium:proton antiporter [Xanthomonadaceae bacterium]|nr:sodium:proton antiporter [Rhodospirillaceae bacterium]NIA17747.1 sodium:proton antiporter [Xanthomonadaceae bacterium]